MAKAENNYIEKASVYGKSMLNVGDNTSTMCLNTVGTVVVKTPGRYITIFKDGKLCVSDSKFIYLVESDEDISSDGIYIVSNDDNNTVYVKSGDLKLLLYNDAEGFVSYTSVQNLSAEQFALALGNIGLYFDTLDSAKSAGITDGIVYITDTGTIYAVSGGTYTDIVTSAVNQALQQFGEIGYDSLHIGAIFIDGENKSVSSETEITFQIDGYDYVVLKGNSVIFRKEIVIGNGSSVSTDRAVKGQSGLLVYSGSDGVTLEVDNLIVHNSDTTASYEPQMYSEYVTSDCQNLISSASWYSAPSQIQLETKYDSGFSVGDTVFVCLSAGLNMADIQWFKDDDGIQWMTVDLENAPTTLTVVEITYYVRDEDDEDNLIERTVEVTIDPDDIDPDDEDQEPNTHGQSQITNEYVDSIESLTVLSGDTNIRYDDGESSYTQSMPGISVATVISADPLVIETQNTDISQNVLDNLAWSPVVRRSTSDGTGHHISVGNGNIVLYETDGDGSVEIASFGQHSDRYGVYASYLEAGEAFASSVDAGVVSAQIVDSVTASFTDLDAVNLALENWAECSAEIPSDPLSDEYDNNVPNVSWVKEIVRQMLQQ